MTDVSPTLLRRLRRADHRAAAELARRAGPEGTYVANALLVGEDGTADLRGLCDRDGTMLALFWIGRRGNLVILGEPAVAPSQLATELAQVDTAWRIALGPMSLIAELARCDALPPLVCRGQVYYGIRSSDGPAAIGHDDAVRLAVRADLPSLCEAAIALNEVDLNVPRARVHQGWLQKTVRRRMREGRTYVIGPVGAPQCKLDIGSRGPAGAVIEGVFTEPGARAGGLATRLVASAASRLLAEHPLVCLHVDEANATARRVYERAGMVADQRCGIILRDG